MVPMLQCGLSRVNFSLPIVKNPLSLCNNLPIHKNTPPPENYLDWADGAESPQWDLNP
jgi:hypothetical protein